jgi:uncharacterized LabA/DUF88 family protein
MAINRTIFLIDGFNIYHSIVEAERLTGKRMKWLNYRAICEAFLPNIGNNAQTENIFYFTAYASHLINKDPDKIKRHNLYISCLEDSGVNLILGRFKEKYVYCPNCKKEFKKHEEKETDVAISTKLFEIFHKNKCDTAVILSGDTDIIPAIKTVKDTFKDKRIGVIFPFKRKNEELKSACDFSFSIKKEKYLKHLLPNPYKLKDGTEIQKPVTW